MLTPYDVDLYYSNRILHEYFKTMICAQYGGYIICFGEKNSMAEACGLLVSNKASACPQKLLGGVDTPVIFKPAIANASFAYTTRDPGLLIGDDFNENIEYICDC